MIGTKLPEWLDRMTPLVGVGGVATAVYVVAMFYYGGSPETWRVGYSPKQPPTKASGTFDQQSHMTH